MQTLELETFTNDAGLQWDAGKLLRDRDGLVCFPCENSYRFGVSLLSVPGVLGLMQTKRRSKKGPALVMVTTPEMAAQVAGPIPEAARKLMDSFWPGRVTLRLPLSKDLPRKVYKELAKPDGMVGLRHPGNQVAAQLVAAAGVPVLVSSANLAKKVGASSVAAIRQKFTRAIDLFIEAGDLPAGPPSTVVEVGKDGEFKITRPGEISEEEIRRVLG